MSNVFAFGISQCLRISINTKKTTHRQGPTGSNPKEGSALPMCGVLEICYPMRGRHRFTPRKYKTRPEPARADAFPIL